jgi:agmatinase
MERSKLPVPDDLPTFLGAPRAADPAWLDADVAVLGVPHGVPYHDDEPESPSAAATRTVRAASLHYAGELHHHDFTFGGEIFAGRSVRIVDCGDVAGPPDDTAGNARRTEAAVRRILDRGAFPLVLGGDDSIPIPVIRGFADRTKPMCVVQIDAHLDWRDERFGVREGLSSPMRRASELPFVQGMIQIGLRGVGSARRAEVEEARAWGSVLVTVPDLRRDGIGTALARLPAGDAFVTFDMDAIDPTLAPGVGSPSFGGLTYDEATELLRGVAARRRVVGFELTEIQPERDVRGQTSALGARLALNLLGALAWSGQIGRER